MSKNILIVGGGYIGNQLHQKLRCPLSRKRIRSYNDILSEIKKYKPKILINGIGHTGKGNVDGCESAIDKTLSANTFVPILLAEAALRNNIKFVHISSGCIYHYNYLKQRPILESFIPDYYDLYYSRTKVYTENVLRELEKRHNILTVRVRIPLDNQPHSKNILTKLIKFKSVIDVPNSITYIPDFINALKHLLKIDARGIYNVVCKTSLRYPQLLDVYQNYYPEFHYKTMKLKELKLSRTNLILSTQKLQKTGFHVRTAQEILEECVKSYIKAERK